MTRKFTPVTAALLIIIGRGSLQAEPSHETLKPKGAAVPMEPLSGKGVWTSPLPKGFKNDGTPLRVTIWFEKQLLGDGKAYQRRASEFSESGRRELRTRVIQSLKSQSEQSHATARAELTRLFNRKIISDLDRHWVVNGFTCSIKKEDVRLLEKVPGVRKIFLRPIRPIATHPVPKIGNRAIQPPSS